MLHYLLAGSAVPYIGNITRDSAEAGRRAAETATFPLEARMDQLELACAGMWELLRDKFQLTDAELLAKIEEIDLRDGTRDHKVKRASGECPTCKRRIATKSRIRCIYCGSDLPQVGFGNV